MEHGEMIDPHVVSLSYRLETDESLKFNNPPALEAETGDFDIRLEDGTLIVRIKTHCATTEEARHLVEPYLEAWKIDVALRLMDSIDFAFIKPEIIDRNPPPPGHVIATASVGMTGEGRLTATATVIRIRGQYPPPPQHFKVSQDVDILWYKYGEYRKGRVPLQDTAFSCLNWLEAQSYAEMTKAGCTKRIDTGKIRERISSKYAVDYAVLIKLGELTSSISDGKNGRKINYKGKHEYRSLTVQETQFLEKVIKALIRRLGEYEAEPNAKFPQITLSDFPSL
jgi:hypothetical protein